MKYLGWIAAGAVVVALLAFLIIDSGKDNEQPSASAGGTAGVTVPTITAPAPTTGTPRSTRSVPACRSPTCT